MENMYRDEILGIVLIALLIALAIGIMYLLTLQNLLKEMSSTNRTVEPANVWIQLIPLVNIIYGFILYPKISESLKNEYEARGMNESGDYIRSLGLAIPILSVVGIIFNQVAPSLGSLINLVSLVVLIIYWVKASEFKKKLQMSQRSEGISSNPDLLD